MFVTATLLSLSLSAEPKAGASNSMKELVKSVGAAASIRSDADGGTQATLVNGIDIARLPFTPESIKRVVLSFQPQIQTCYEETLAAQDKALEGTLKTAFKITPDGMVTGARIDKRGSSLKDPKLHDCVVSVLSTMQFPAPPDGKPRPIEFPFNLKAVQ
jgi:hypothetical protein